MHGETIKFSRLIFAPSSYLVCLPSAQIYIKHKNNDQLELILNNHAIYSMTMKTKTFFTYFLVITKSFLFRTTY